MDEFSNQPKTLCVDSYKDIGFEQLKFKTHNHGMIQSLSQILFLFPFVLS